MSGTEIILLIGLAAVCALLILMWSKLNKPNHSDGALTMLQNQLQQIAHSQNEKLDRTIKELNDRLSEQNRTLNDQMRESRLTMQNQLSLSQKALRDTSDSTQKIVKEVTEKLTRLDETNKQVMGFAAQLQSLENILKNPKQRGVLGEYFLETVLKNVLPPDAYKMQYKFANGEIVDGLIITRDKSIPVDAKFSLENYNRMAVAENTEERLRLEKTFKSDLKQRIEETAKYIRPEEGTYDFAFMFIPADGLYYDLLVNKIGNLESSSNSIMEYAFTKRVIVVSPTTLFAYLQTVLQGLRALSIEESAKEIQANVAKLQKHLNAYEDNFRKLGDHLNRAVSAYANTSDEYRKIDKDVVRITQLQLETQEQLTLGVDLDA
jgi:DNA recombination protein RmuC